MYDFSNNIQRGILHLLKGDPEFFSQVVSLVKGKYFEYPVHEEIYNIIREYHNEYMSLPTNDYILETAKQSKSTSLSEMKVELEDIDQIDRDSIRNKEFIMDLVEDFAKKEALKDAIKDSVQYLKTEDYGKIEDTIKEALRVSRNVDIGQKYFEDYSDRFKRTYELTEENRDYFKTMIPTVNRALEGGLERGELGLIVAPPGVGKSLFLANQAVQSLMENRNVLYLTLEMSEDKTASRIDSIATRISQFNLKKDPMSLMKAKDRLGIFQNTYNDGKLIIKAFPAGTANVYDVRALLSVLRIHEEFVPDVLIVDYVGLMNCTVKGMAKYEAMEHVLTDLRGVCQENNLVGWTATQTNRAGRNVQIITDSELGDSYGQIRPVDFAFSLNQTREEYDNNQMRGYAMKVRNGGSFFIVPMSVDYNILTISEREVSDDEDILSELG